MDTSDTRVITCEGDPSLPHIVMLHGWGANEHDLAFFADIMQTGTTWHFMGAPISLGTGGYCWFPEDLSVFESMDPLTYFHRLAEDIWPELERSSRSLRARIVSVAGPDTPIILGGFSQGAILALSQIVLPVIDNPLLGVIAFSPGLWDAHGIKEALRSRYARVPPVFLSHGIHDPILPITGTETWNDILKEFGTEIEYHRFNGYHEVPEFICRRAEGFITRICTNSSPNTSTFS